MKVVTNTNDTLIIKGYSVLRFALLDWQTLAPPLSVYLAALLFSSGIEPARPYVWVGGAIFVLICLYGWARQNYTDWQLILESDFETAAIYARRWAGPKRAAKFGLDTVKDAACVKREWTETTRYGTSDKVEYALVVTRTTGYVDRTLSTGPRDDINQMSDIINGWLSVHRHR